MSEGTDVLECYGIANRIRQQREALGYSLKEVADQVGVAISTIQRYESGEIKRHKIPVLIAIAAALQVDVLWLMGKSELQTPAHTGLLHQLDYTIDHTSENGLLATPLFLDSVESAEVRRLITLAKRLALVPLETRTRMIDHFQDMIETYLAALAMPAQETSFSVVSAPVSPAASSSGGAIAARGGGVRPETAEESRRAQLVYDKLVKPAIKRKARSEEG